MDEINEVPLEIPKDSSFGDFATTLALQLAKSVKQNPRALAEKIVNEIMSSHESKYIESASVAGPGFINFKLSNRWLVQTIEMARQFKGNYGTTDFGKGQKVLVEFVSANPTGPLNVVNARAAAVGDTLVRILKATGYKGRVGVLRERCGKPGRHNGKFGPGKVQTDNPTRISFP